MRVVLRPSVVLLTAALVMAVPTLDGDRVGVQAGIPAPTLLRYPYVQQVTMTSALVVWTTSEDGTSEVRFGTDSSPGSTVVATSQQFIEPEIPDEVARTYYVHVAELSGLQPGETYGYTVLSGGIDLTSADSLSFRTDSGPSDPTLSLLVFGDSGTGVPNQLGIRDAMSGRDFDLAIHTGDIAYVSGTYRQLEDNFFAVYKDLAARTPFFPSLGNHGYLTLRGQPYLDVFYLPENAVRPVHKERYYSFDYGPVHFVALDTEIWAGFFFWGQLAFDNMLTWLEDDLAATEQPWKFVYFHRPPYSSSNVPVAYDPRKIVQVLEQYDVDLVLDGHDHVYARTLPLKDGQAELIGEGGIVYVTTGGGGAGKHLCEPRPFTASCLRRYHFLDLSINNDCQLSYDVVGFRQELIETFELDRCDPDSDGDSYTDAAEAQAGSDPLDPSSAPPTPTPTPFPSLVNIGDANCDGTIDSIDAAIVLQNTAQLLTFLPCSLFADVNRDGRINSVDAALILQFSAGLISTLPP
ncbi:MAG: metallophosphoesterase [Chloroflexi bacterium]|nr:metallophosphoesterase [Chloroflexota bacterium]